MDPARTTALPETQCPRCGSTFNAASNETSEVARGPQAGDFTICVYCAVVLVFEEHCALRQVTRSDMLHLSPGDMLRVMAMQAHVIETTVKDRVLRN